MKIESLEKILDKTKTGVVFFERDENQESSHDQITVKEVSQSVIDSFDLASLEEVNRQEIRQIELARVSVLTLADPDEIQEDEMPDEELKVPDRLIVSEAIERLNHSEINNTKFRQESEPAV